MKLTNTILFLSEDILMDYIVLQPQWLVDAFKCLITAEQFCQKKGEVFKQWLDFNKTAILRKDLIGYIYIFYILRFIFFLTTG